MREFIAGAAFLLALLVVMTAAWGMMFPARLAKPNEPVPSRKSILFSGIFAALVLCGIGTVVLPAGQAPEVSEHTADVTKLKQLRADISAIENRFEQQMNAFASVLMRLHLNKDVSDAERTKPVGISFGEMIATLERSNSLQVPDIAHPEARRYAADAVAAHKKWALTMQAKVAALAKGDLDKVDSLRASSDGFATEEAVALSLAYKTLGVAVEVE